MIIITEQIDSQEEDNKTDKLKIIIATPKIETENSSNKLHLMAINKKN